MILKTIKKTWKFKISHEKRFHRLNLNFQSLFKQRKTRLQFSAEKIILKDSKKWESWKVY